MNNTLNALLCDIIVGVANLNTKLDVVLRRIARLEKKDDLLMATLDDLVTAVAAESTVVDSAIVLLNGLKAALDAAIASGDPAKIQAVSDSIGAQTVKLSDAVTQNTPAA